jgi:hypothetical protein
LLLLLLLLLLQAGDNFQHELLALRRSVRYNEYAALEAPPNALARVSSAAALTHSCCLICCVNLCKRVAGALLLQHSRLLYFPAA